MPGDGVKKYRGVCIFASCENEEIEKMTIKEDDIWVLSVPRSGTTVTQEIVYLLKNKLDFEGARSKDLDARFPFLDLYWPEMPNFQGLRAIEAQTKDRLIKSHLHYHLLPPDLFKSNCKKVYVMRNPKDVFVSNLMISKTLGQVEPESEGKEHLDMWMNGEVNATPWWLHVHDFYLHKDDQNILFLMYEDIVKDMPGAIRSIAAHINIPVTADEVTKIADHCSFENMHANKSVNASWQWDHRNWNPSFGGFIRKGKVGGWRDDLTPEMSDKLDTMVEQKLGHLHIPFDYGE